MAQIISEPKERLKECMDEFGYTQADTARLADVGKDRINRYLKGVCKPGNKHLFSLAQIFNVSPLWLMGYDVPKRESTEQRNLKSEINYKLDRMSEQQLLKVKRFIEEFID